MNDKQRQAQLDYERSTGIHNTSPCYCGHCGKFITVGMKTKCPHERTNQKTCVYPLGRDGTT